jgi:hypothetical protein
MIPSHDVFESATSNCTITSTMKMDTTLSGCSPMANKRMILQYAQALDLVENSPATKNRRGTALGNFMEQLLNDALLVVNDSTYGRQDEEPQDKSNSGRNETTRTSHRSRNKGTNFVVVVDNAKLPSRKKKSVSFSREVPQRSQSDRTEVKRDSRWGNLNIRCPKTASLTAPVRTASHEYSDLPMPTVPGRNSTNMGRSHQRMVPKKVHSVDIIPSYPQSGRRCSN